MMDARVAAVYRAYRESPTFVTWRRAGLVDQRGETPATVVYLRPQRRRTRLVVGCALALACLGVAFPLVGLVVALTVGGLAGVTFAVERAYWRSRARAVWGSGGPPGEGSFTKLQSGPRGWGEYRNRFFPSG